MNSSLSNALWCPYLNLNRTSTRVSMMASSPISEPHPRSGAESLALADSNETIDDLHIHLVASVIWKSAQGQLGWGGWGMVMWCLCSYILVSSFLIGSHWAFYHVV